MAHGSIFTFSLNGCSGAEASLYAGLVTTTKSARLSKAVSTGFING